VEKIYGHTKMTEIQYPAMIGYNFQQAEEYDITISEKVCDSTISSVDGESGDAITCFSDTGGRITVGETAQGPVAFKPFFSTNRIGTTNSIIGSGDYTIATCIDNSESLSNRYTIFIQNYEIISDKPPIIQSIEIVTASEPTASSTTFPNYYADYLVYGLYNGLASSITFSEGQTFNRSGPGNVIYLWFPEWSTGFNNSVIYASEGTISDVRCSGGQSGGVGVVAFLYNDLDQMTVNHIGRKVTNLDFPRLRPGLGIISGAFTHLSSGFKTASFGDIPLITRDMVTTSGLVYLIGDWSGDTTQAAILTYNFDKIEIFGEIVRATDEVHGMVINADSSGIYAGFVFQGTLTTGDGTRIGASSGLEAISIVKYKNDGSVAYWYQLGNRISEDIYTFLTINSIQIYSKGVAITGYINGFFYVQDNDYCWLCPIDGGGAASNIHIIELPLDITGDGITLNVAFGRIGISDTNSVFTLIMPKEF
jgi:hypothetical protein